MLAIVGLGNPGSEYHGTRHNIGFAVVDALAKSLNINFHAGSGDYLAGSEKNNFLLIKPLTYMNNSGTAVREIMENFSITINDVLVIVDDFHIPLGELRLRTKGTSGGHNGLASIIRHLASDEFPRLRCGIGSAHKPEEKYETANFVLSVFEQGEKNIVAEMIGQACDILRIAGEQSIAAAIDRLSRTKI